MMNNLGLKENSDILAFNKIGQVFDQSKKPMITDVKIANNVAIAISPTKINMNKNYITNTENTISNSNKKSRRYRKNDNTSFRSNTSHRTISDNISVKSHNVERPKSPINKSAQALKSEL